VGAGVRATGAIDAIVIGRNEGPRLVACLASLAGQVRRVVYVDSGSTDGSVAAAAAAGAVVVTLDAAAPFTAARARNAGLAAVMAAPDPPRFIQFVDGDCAVEPGWVAFAAAFLEANPQAAVACGRRRERFPEASVYNRVIDREWDTPVGPARACGGDALMRASAVAAAGGYRAELIAGEEPELCLRLRRAGWEVWRLDHPMTLHDAAILRFGQWWRRTRRAGHAFAEGAALHGAGPERHWVAETRRAVLWGAVLPLAALAAGLVHPAGLALMLAWPAQAVRLALRWGGRRADWEAAVLTVLGKPAEAQGVIGFWLGRITGRRRGLIEYRRP
jgi:GT2 family glycosyltransferase